MESRITAGEGWGRVQGAGIEKKKEPINNFG